MTGAYLMAERDGNRAPVEIEHLTDEERLTKFAKMTPQEITGWVNFLCRFIRQCEEAGWP